MKMQHKNFLKHLKKKTESNMKLMKESIVRSEVVINLINGMLEEE